MTWLDFGILFSGILAILLSRIPTRFNRMDAPTKRLVVGTALVFIAGIVSAAGIFGGESSSSFPVFVSRVFMLAAVNQGVYRLVK